MSTFRNVFEMAADFDNDEAAIDYANGIYWGDVIINDDEQTIAHARYVDDAADGTVEVWYDYGADYYFFVDVGDIDDDYDDGMDGDAESALASAGWGTDEDYGYYGD